VMVGINKYRTNKQDPIPLVEIDEQIHDEQNKRLREIKQRRNNSAVRKSLLELKNACRKDDNVMPDCIEAVRNLATLQEICDVYREVFGEYRDPGFY